MSSRSAKKSSRVMQQTATSSSTPETPSTSTPRSTPGRHRPPSPTSISRTQEKRELASLNDRLANYIDRVRSLENENKHLHSQARIHEETVTREVTNIKSLYETELADARKLLDETSKEKARFQIEYGKYKSEAEEWKSKYLRANNELKNAEKKLLAAEGQVNELQARLNDAVNQRKHWESEYHKIKSEFTTLEKQLATAKKQLEDETISRVDLENKVQSLKEEMVFKNEVSSQELNETRKRIEVQIDEVDGELQRQYDSKLKEALQDMRADNDMSIRVARDEVETLFEKKLADQKAAADRHEEAKQSLRDELKTTRRRIDELNSNMTKLSTQNANYEARIRELEAQLLREKNDHDAIVDTKEDEIRRLKIELDNQLQEFQDLLDTKIALDVEIKAYQKLLEAEESRLNISSATEATPGRDTPHRSLAPSRKRKRFGDVGEPAGMGTFMESTNTGYATNSESKGNIEIHETDGEGNFIKLFNKADKDQSVAGWQIKHTAGDDTTVYKFTRAGKVPAGQYVTIWSSDSSATHAPPNEIKMKGQRWVQADEMKTILVNPQGEEMASREMSKSMLHTTRSYRSRLSSTDTVDSGIEEQGDKCSIM